MPAALPAAVAEALDRFAGAVRERFGDRVREIVLFGSHARGEATEDSDVDVLVAIDDLSHEERLEVLDVAYAADSFTAGAADELVGLSPLAYSTAQATRLRSGGRRLLRDIDREGVRL